MPRAYRKAGAPRLRCQACGRVKDRSEFAPNRAGHYHKHCNACRESKPRTYKPRARRASIEVGNYLDGAMPVNLRVTRSEVWLLWYLKTHPCVDCGESRPFVLEFDAPVNVRRLAARSAPLLEIQQAVAQSEIRCANCLRLVRLPNPAQVAGSWLEDEQNMQTAARW